MTIPEISEIKITNFNLDEDGNLSKLFRLYINVLLKDNWWHFFREGDYTLIRCTQQSVNEVTQFFHNLEIDPEQLEFTEVWKDNIPRTRKYQDEFTYMFHAFSVLSMKMYEEEIHLEMDDVMDNFTGIFDRVVHCFLNTARTDLKTEGFKPFIPIKNENHVFALWESMIITHNALMRMYSIGNYSGKREVQRAVRFRER
jgi:hypothetical protein